MRAAKPEAWGRAIRATVANAPEGRHLERCPRGLVFPRPVSVAYGGRTRCELVRETRLDAGDVVYPLFVCPGTDVDQPLEGLAGIASRSVERLCDEAEEAAGFGVQALLLFGIPRRRTRWLRAPTPRTGSSSERSERCARGFRALVLAIPTCACASTRRTATAGSSATVRSVERSQPRAPGAHGAVARRGGGGRRRAERHDGRPGRSDPARARR